MPALTMFVDAALIVLCSLCDRARGGWTIVPSAGQTAAKFLYGAVLGYLIGLPVPLCIATSVLWWVGEKPGWGYPIGMAVLGKVQHQWAHPDAKPEKWQVGPLKNAPWASLIVRGAIWGLPATLLYPWAPEVPALPLAMAVAMPVGALFDRVTGNRYKAGEFVRGGVMGLMCAFSPLS